MAVIYKTDVNFKKTRLFFERILGLAHAGYFDKYGRLGVEALKEGTPKHSTETANSWSYKVVYGTDRTEINFYNSNIENGVCVAMLLEYGHGTRHGGYVSGRRFIEPSIYPIFEQMVQEIWKEVKGR